ncbi:MAG: Rne/Rng family ribonuclease [Deltaproteobacteria bacterium]|nr:Rne/Rng family ribonuclease [Deltaproteobacteria bacterium]
MSNELIINATDYETRVALIENGSVAELYVERHGEKGIVGNVYKGKVVRVLPGMQAAFVDIGLEKAAFLYAGDVYLSDQTTPMSQVHLMEGEVDADIPESFEDEATGEGMEEHALKESADEGEGEGSENGGTENHSHVESGKSESRPKPMSRFKRGARRYQERLHIADLLKEGQEVLVQVTKNPISTKGARLTMHLSIPGRNLVLMPSYGYVGVSRRIASDRERKRLKEFVQSICPPGLGIIVRTAAEGQKKNVIQADQEYLTKIWQGIEKDIHHAPAPFLLHEELDIVLRTLRDMFVDHVDRIIVDSKKEHLKILRFLDSFNPAMKRVVKYYKGREPIFDTYGVEIEINRALGRRVWLKSGGYIIVDQAEALTVIDVNTGRYVGKENFDQTILRINLEAAQEIANQLRLRNCGGIIIIDFIDMENRHHREKVYRAFDESLSYDRAKNSILKISELGLIEMTRKRTRESLMQTLCGPCFYCEGKGYLKSKRTIIYEIFRELIKTQGDIHTRVLQLIVHPEIEREMKEDMPDGLEKIEKQVHKEIQLLTNRDFHVEQFEIKSQAVSAKNDLTPPENVPINGDSQ